MSAPNSPSSPSSREQLPASPGIPTECEPAVVHDATFAVRLQAMEAELTRRVERLTHAYSSSAVDEEPTPSDAVGRNAGQEGDGRNLPSTVASSSAPRDLGQEATSAEVAAGQDRSTEDEQKCGPRAESSRRQQLQDDAYGGGEAVARPARSSGASADPHGALDRFERLLSALRNEVLQAAAETEAARREGIRRRDAELRADELARDVARLAADRDGLARDQERTAAAVQRLEAECQAAKQHAELAAATAEDSTRDAVAYQSQFELALGDVQRLKRENSELREQLAARSQDDGNLAPELAAVRRERDALASRVAELEGHGQALDLGVEEQMQDLQRRFELAVEDVRRLKQENMALRTREPRSAEADCAADRLDWASQKARLLALLEEEDQPDSGTPEERERERQGLKQAIALTDRVVAEKAASLARLEAEVTELREQLAARNSATAAVQDEQHLASDARVQQERARLADLQAEWQEKVRVAELEISVERARLARERAVLETSRAAIESARSELAAKTEDAADAKPRRKWLGALGLRDDG